MSEDGKQKIIDAAKRVITKSGIPGATMRGIAEEAGISTGAIYHYYKSKDEILYDVMDSNPAASTRIAKESVTGEKTCAELVDAICDSVLQHFAKEDENRLQFYLAQEAMMGNEELKAKFKKKYSEWSESIELLIQNMYGKTPTKYNKAIASLLIAVVDGFVLQLQLCSNPAEVQDVVEVYRQILTNGVPHMWERLAAKSY